MKSQLRLNEEPLKHALLTEKLKSVHKIFFFNVFDVNYIGSATLNEQAASDSLPRMSLSILKHAHPHTPHELEFGSGKLQRNS